MRHLADPMTPVAHQTAPQITSPIGIFDSGVGGLSVLRHIRSQLPLENLIYFADSAHAPYGDKTESEIVTRSLAIATHLLERECKALVVACNTATAAAIHVLRERFPDIPIVGVEPGLKPATALTKVRRIGVMATDRTLASDKFRMLRDQLTASSDVVFESQACTGLADSIEKGELASWKTRDLVQRCVTPLAEAGVDTIVLGCTHYPFVQNLIESAAEKSGIKNVMIIDTGEPVARRLTQQLKDHGLAQNGGTKGFLHSCTTGDPQALAAAFDKLLGLQPPIEKQTI